MTTCDDIQEHLGPYFDGELSPDERAEIEAHLTGCPACGSELEEIRLLADALAPSAPTQVPTDLWSSLERRLDAFDNRRRRAGPRLLRFPPRLRLATAAAIVLAAGLGLLGLLSHEPTAAASDINFAVLLDGLPFDAPQAFAKFVAQYAGKRSTPSEARQYAPTLNFSTPDELPGGFRLQEVFTLRVGPHPGVAARYDRNGEFLGAVFHPPMCRERMGSHKNYPCVIGQHCGHKVQVGDWKLVHLTDPTTCHCVLSRLDEQRELPAVLTAVAPVSSFENSNHGDGFREIPSATDQGSCRRDLSDHIAAGAEIR